MPSTPAADRGANASPDNPKLIHASPSGDTGLVAPRTLCRGHPGRATSWRGPLAQTQRFHRIEDLLPATYHSALIVQNGKDWKPRLHSCATDNP